VAVVAEGAGPEERDAGRRQHHSGAEVADLGADLIAAGGVRRAHAVEPGGVEQPGSVDVAAGGGK
jgi:hypothetical protein